jgi:hypothetical protein
MTEYTLRYQYEYEPGFNVYRLLDLILYRSDDYDTAEMDRYIKKEAELIDDEDTFQTFFVVKRFYFSDKPTPKWFLKVALFPNEKKETCVVNLQYIPLIKPLEEYSEAEKDSLLKELVWAEEKSIGFKYEIVDTEESELYVENSIEEFEDSFEDDDGELTDDYVHNI